MSSPDVNKPNGAVSVIYLEIDKAGSDLGNSPLPTDFWSNPELLKSIEILQRFTSLDIVHELENPSTGESMPAQVLARLMLGVEPAIDCLIKHFKTYESKYKDVSTINYTDNNGHTLNIGQFGLDYGGYVQIFIELEGIETHIHAAYPEDRELERMRRFGWVNEFQTYYAEIPKDSAPESDQDRFKDDRFVRYYAFRPTTYKNGGEPLEFAKYEIARYYSVLCHTLVATAQMINVPKELWAKPPIADDGFDVSPHTDK